MPFRWIRAAHGPDRRMPVLEAVDEQDSGMEISGDAPFLVVDSDKSQTLFVKSILNTRVIEEAHSRSQPIGDEEPVPASHHHWDASLEVRPNSVGRLEKRFQPRAHRKPSPVRITKRSNSYTPGHLIDNRFPVRQDRCNQGHRNQQN